MLEDFRVCGYDRETDSVLVEPLDTTLEHRVKASSAAAALELESAVLDFVEANPNATTRAVVAAIPKKTAAVLAALGRLERRGLLTSEDGPKNARRWRLRDA